LVVLLAWRRETWRRLWIALAPLAIYGLWFLEYGSPNATFAHLRRVPGYVWQAASNAAGAIGGRPVTFGYYFIVALAVAGVVHILRRGVSALTAALVVMPLVYWVLLAITRSNLAPPSTSRYIYVGAVLLLLIVGQVASEWAGKIHVVALPLLAAFVGWSISGNLMQFPPAAGFLRESWGSITTEVGAVQLVRRDVHPHFVVDPLFVPGGEAAEFFAAERDLGNFAPPLSELRRAPELYREAADGSILRWVTSQVSSAHAPSVGSGPISVLIASSRSVVVDGPCALLAGGTRPASVLLQGHELDISLTSVSGTVSVLSGVASLAGHAAAVAIPVENGRTTVVRLPRWVVGPWRLEMSTSGRVSICAITVSTPSGVPHTQSTPIKRAIGKTAPAVHSDITRRL
jgi:hypothetical protein